MILYSRWALYAQAVLLMVVAVVGFGSGYFIGLGGVEQQTHIARKKAESRSAALSGKLFYNPGTGQIALDAGAVVIALPDGVFPERPLSIIGIRPKDPPPPETHETVRAIGELGGAYARADASGEFLITVARTGAYRLLFISAHAARAEGAMIDEVDEMEIERYFKPAERLIGRYKYRWMVREVKAGSESIPIDFGRDEQAS
jgi:hypothetical protein